MTALTSPGRQLLVWQDHEQRDEALVYARTDWAALELFRRASSLPESLHSWLRPHLRAHMCNPDWLLPLL